MNVADPASARTWTSQRPHEVRDAWETLVTGAPVVCVRAGDPLPPDGVLRSPAAVLDGVLRTYITVARGRQFTVRYAHCGELVGLVPALLSTDLLSGEAVTDAVVAALGADQLQELALRDARFALSLAADLAAGSLRATHLLATAHFGSTLSQVATHLLERAVDSQDSRWVAQVSHHQLAEATGTAREVVTRTLAMLRDAGIVETRRGAVVICDRDTLARIAVGDVPERSSVGAAAQRTTTARTPPRIPAPSTSQAT